MRAARCSQLGPPSSVVVVEVPDPEPGPGEVLVRVRYAAVNFPDVLMIAGTYQVAIPTPFTPGSEFAGEVAAVGPDVDSWRPGDLVTGSVFAGAFAEAVVVPAARVTAVPAGMRADLAAAAAFHVTYSTAYHSLVTIGGARAGQPALVLGAAGGVGSACVDVATRLGVPVVAAASSPERISTALDLGAVAGIDYSAEDLKTRAKELTGGGADLVVDPVGGPYSEAALRATRWGGRFVVVGFATGEIPRIPLNLVLLKGVILRGFELRTLPDLDPAAVEEGQVVLARLVGEGMRPYVSRVRALAEVAEALTEVAERRAVGKVVLACTD
jgi:NADPH2:quinone reductase